MGVAYTNGWGLYKWVGLVLMGVAYTRVGLCEL